MHEVRPFTRNKNPAHSVYPLQSRAAHTRLFHRDKKDMVEKLHRSHGLEGVRRSLALRREASPSDLLSKQESSTNAVVHLIHCSDDGGVEAKRYTSLDGLTAVRFTACPATLFREVYQGRFAFSCL